MIRWKRKRKFKCMPVVHCFVSFSLLCLAGNIRIIGILDHYGKAVCLFACRIKHPWRLQGSFFSWWGLSWPRMWRLVHRLVTSSMWGPLKFGTYSVQTHLSFVGIWQNSMPSLVSDSGEPCSDSFEVVSLFWNYFHILEVDNVLWLLHNCVATVVQYLL